MNRPGNPNSKRKTEQNAGVGGHRKNAFDQRMRERVQHSELQRGNTMESTNLFIRDCTVAVMQQSASIDVYPN